MSKQSSVGGCPACFVSFHPPSTLAKFWSLADVGDMNSSNVANPSIDHSPR
ncbi:hypothetical protein PF007_g11506 [Phytophthora fragariae]|uniref:Uncharacterized protein n=1 Tax=Phytophthora fragariae TaxID=53985 RepID=A0A6A3S9J6_9STRA|nr:hypothetical protein PF003_g7253 [Phytophthora fragariae]KAE8953275.1 hypothetical protein PF011_g32459 [Phytophthora fragariae]KAE9111379.1 hypothetical protein PF007_g11506 [Phytophthora fragariae]KAE9259870.1 hypothetical protein PF008_g33255 [Phytophthora fragariae]